MRLNGQQLQVLDFDSAANELSVVRSFQHDAQVQSLAPSPFAKDLVITCGKTQGQTTTQATLWRMNGLEDPQPEGDSASQPLVAVAEIPQQKLPVSCVAWNAGDEASSSVVASAHGNVLRTWSLTDQAVEPQDRLELDLSLDPSSSIGAVRWDPHHTQLLSYAFGSGIQTWDTRINDVAFAIPEAHLQTVLDIDYNPNKPYCLVSGGDDGKMKFWDLRHVRTPLLALNAHSHWVSSVRYNRFHDQLVLSSSTDSTAALWRVSSISSAPIVELDDQDLMNESSASADVVDTKVKSFEEHEDSVYAVTWAVSDSWLFASVSYDGRVAVNQVPSTEKYKILL